MATSRRDAMYGGKKSEPAEPMANVEEEHAGGAGEAEGQPAEAGGDRRLAAWQALAKQHETERRDLHGSHDQQHKAMLGRHEKAFKDLAKQHMEELGTEGAGPPPRNEEGSEPGEPSGLRGA